MKAANLTNLDMACRAFGWAGGTIHQVAEALGRPGQGNELALMPSTHFAALLRAFEQNKQLPCRPISPDSFKPQRPT